MKWLEIQGAMAIDLDGEEVQWDHRTFREDGKELCGSLIEVHGDEVVDVVHRTARMCVKGLLRGCWIC